MPNHIFIPPKKQSDFEKFADWAPSRSPWRVLLAVVVVLAGLAAAIFGLWCMATAVIMADHGTDDVLTVVLLLLASSLVFAGPLGALVCLGMLFD